MFKKIVLSVSTLTILVSLQAQEVEEKRDRIHSVRKVVDQVGKIDTKEVSEVDKARKMFSDGKVSGQLRLMYSQAPDTSGAYTSVVGGIIKYELAEYHGFNAGAAVYTSYDLPFASGKDTKRYTDLSSSEGDHTDMSEAYINYRYEDLNFRAGRQVLDTPLADSDDIRVIQNTFEAYIATYNIKGIELMAGHIQNWHGTDAGLDNAWVDTGKNGVNFAGISYQDGLEYNAWYYNITGETNAVYLDIGMEYPLNEDILFHAGIQYLNESELDNSKIEASIYGALIEVVAYDIGINLAVNKSDKQVGKKSFSGYGGGTLYTNMDTMILDEISEDRDVLALVAGISYSINKFGFLYAYGDFWGDENSANKKEHIIEQDVGAGYNFNDEFVVALLFSDFQDKENADADWNRVQVMLNYNF